MQEHAMTVNDLARVLGSQPNASLILHGKLSLYPAKLRDKILLNPPSTAKGQAALKPISQVMARLLS